MFFTYTARIFAIIGFVLGIVRVSIGLAIALRLLGPYGAALEEFTAASSSGEVIKGGFLYIFFAVAFGVLAEISLAVRKAADKS